MWHNYYTPTNQNFLNYDQWHACEHLCECDEKPYTLSWIINMRPHTVIYAVIKLHVVYICMAWQWSICKYATITTNTINTQDCRCSNIYISYWSPYYTSLLTEQTLLVLATLVFNYQNKVYRNITDIRFQFNSIVINTDR